MPDPANVLTQKLGGVPAYVWVGVVGVAGAGVIWYMNRRSTSSAAVSGQQATLQGAYPGSSSVLPSAPPVTYITGIPPFAQPGGSTPQSPAAGGDTPVNPGDWVRAGAGYAYQPGGSDATFTKGGRTYFHLRDLQSANTYIQGGGSTWFFPAPGVPMPLPWGAPGLGQGTAVYGATSAGSGGMGGVSSKAAHGASPWQAFSQRWHAPAYTGWGMGGGQGAGAGSGAHVGAIAKQTRIPSARILSANPQIRRQAGRVGRSDLVRIS